MSVSLLEMKNFFDWLDKWLSPQRQVTAEEDIADSLVLFVILLALLFVIMKD